MPKKKSASSDKSANKGGRPKKLPAVPRLQCLAPSECYFDLYYWDEDAAQLIIDFASKYCRHIKGEWAGRPVELDQWEVEILRTVFGWKRKSDGNRRFSTLYLEVPRKNGKSLIASVIGLFLLLCDKEPGAEVYSAATDRRQAGLVFNTAKQMVKKDPALSRRAKPFKQTIVVEKTDSVYEVLSAEAFTKDGLNAHGIIFDELHAQPTRDLYDVLRTSVGARRQPLEVYITTAGTSLESICYEVHDYAIKVRDGIIRDDTFFGKIYAAEADDDWTSPEVWAKANPGLGTSVKIEYLQKRCNEAKAKPSFLNTFKRLHLNIWTGEGQSWLPWDLWAKRAGDYSLESLLGQKCWIGLDLSKRIDITAMTAVFFDEEINGLKSIHKFWMPEDRAEERAAQDRVPYLQWAEQGFLELTEGNVVDYQVVFNEILDWHDKFDVVETVLDRWGSTAISSALQKRDIEPVEFGQGYRDMSPAMKDLEALIMQARFLHPNNPLMNWMMSSVVIKTDEADNIKPDKRKSRNRIDGPVSLIMASGRCLASTEDLSSVYDEGDLKII
ncbi:MAG: terminase large subunit [Candidatus Melainabacteria bacterium]|nr:terminase large subunit [Candidatus Melainabacteria bacterium]